MALKVFINGTLYNKEDAKVSVYDHGFLYGDGVFEGMRSYGGSVFRMKEHLDRLWNPLRRFSWKFYVERTDGGFGKRDAGCE